jgi:glycosyltransferase involved in cell wall biosynthesis
MKRPVRHLKSIAHHIRQERKDDIGRNLRRFRFRRRLRARAVSRPPRYEQAAEIIIPCYNHASYLEEAFESVVAQTWRRYPLTVTLIDDCSTDGTPEVIQRLRNRATARLRVTTLRNDKNLRQWASLNRVIGASENELMIVLNDDDALVPDALEKIFFAFEGHPELAMVGGSSIWFSEKDDRPAHIEQPAGDLLLTIYPPEGTSNYRNLNDLNMTHSSCSFFRFAWKAVSGYRPPNKRVHSIVAEDRDFQMRVNALFPVGVFSDYPLAYWRSDSSHGYGY